MISVAGSNFSHIRRKLSHRVIWKKSKNQVSNSSHKLQKLLKQQSCWFHMHAFLTDCSSAVLPAQAFLIKSAFPLMTNFSKKTRTKASHAHKTKTTHQGNGMSCSCNLYILKMKEADRKTGNYTKEFIPKVMIKIHFKNAHYWHLKRQYIHSRSQVRRLCREWSLQAAHCTGQDGEQQGSLHSELVHFLCWGQPCSLSSLYKNPGRDSSLSTAL